MTGKFLISYNWYQQQLDPKYRQTSAPTQLSRSSSSPHTEEIKFTILRLSIFAERRLVGGGRRDNTQNVDVSACRLKSNHYRALLINQRMYLLISLLGTISLSSPLPTHPQQNTIESNLFFITLAVVRVSLTSTSLTYPPPNNIYILPHNHVWVKITILPLISIFAPSILLLTGTTDGTGKRSRHALETPTTAPFNYEIIMYF